MLNLFCIDFCSFICFDYFGIKSTATVDALHSYLDLLNDMLTAFNLLADNDIPRKSFNDCKIHRRFDWRRSLWILFDAIWLFTPKWMRLDARVVWIDSNLSTREKENQYQWNCLCFSWRDLMLFAARTVMFTGKRFSFWNSLCCCWVHRQELSIWMAQGKMKHEEKSISEHKKGTRFDWKRLQRWNQCTTAVHANCVGQHPTDFFPYLTIIHSTVDRNQ